MHLTTTPTLSRATDAPQAVADPVLDAVKATRAPIILDIQPRYVMGGEAANPGAAMAVINLADEALMIPAGNAHPILLEDGKGLRFGLDATLVHEADLVFDMSGDWSVAWVSRISAGPGSGGPLVGARLDAGWSWLGFDFTTTNLSYFVNQLLAGALTNSQGTGTWKRYVATYDASAGDLLFSIEGGLPTGDTDVPESWGAPTPLMIGGFGANAPAGYFVGDLGCIAVFPGRCLQDPGEADTLAAVMPWLTQVQARVSA